MEESKKSPSALELLRRIQELEERRAHIIPEISKLMLSRNRSIPGLQGSSSASPLPVLGETNGGDMMDPYAMKLTETQYCNIVHSMGQAIHIWDCKRRIIFWSQAAESLFGYTAAEAYGRTPVELLAEPKDASAGDYVLDRAAKGQIWAGEFPIKTKRGERFVVIITLTPFLDENGRLVGTMCVSADSRLFDIIKADLTVGAATRIHFDSQQPRHISLASKISNVALKVKAKLKTGADHDFAASDDTFQSEARTPGGHIGLYPFGVFYTLDTADHFRGTRTKGYGEEIEEKHGICKVLSSKAGKWMGKRRSAWPWKQNEIQLESLDFNQAHKYGPQMSFADLHSQLCEKTNSGSNKIEASGLWLSTLHFSSSSSSSSISSEENSNEEMSIESNAIVQVEGETVSMDYEILWEDLIINDQIGQGSCANVYHALWYGSDVSIKLFKHQEYYDDVIVRFKQEVSSVKRLRHPNILLFIGAVTSRQHLSIVTEFLPRGCLFRILQQNSTRLDWRRRLHMAMDIARGMKYLHHCNPPILHLDLKSSNLFVDKNWTVKVGDFGFSRIKDQTRLNMKADKGTPQWMAPEILRNEDANEKSDVYSYGVILWEIITEKIPWNDLNPMQVIAAVGFMNQRLEIPKDVDPLWASLIESCWFSDPQSRPTFQEILYKLKDMQRKFAVEHWI